MKFFVDVDRETIKQIVVTALPGPVFHAGISLLLDRGREAPVSRTKLDGVSALRKFLIQQDVPEEAIIAELGENPAKPARIWQISATSVAGSFLLGGGVMLAHYCM